MLAVFPIHSLRLEINDRAVICDFGGGTDLIAHSRRSLDLRPTRIAVHISRRTNAADQSGKCLAKFEWGAGSNRRVRPIIRT